jgi:hypothetical protein
MVQLKVIEGGMNNVHQKFENVMSDKDADALEAYIKEHETMGTDSLQWTLIPFGQAVKKDIPLQNSDRYESDGIFVSRISGRHNVEMHDFIYEITKDMGAIANHYPYLLTSEVQQIGWSSKGNEMNRPAFSPKAYIWENSFDHLIAYYMVNDSDGGELVVTKQRTDDTKLAPEFEPNEIIPMKKNTLYVFNGKHLHTFVHPKSGIDKVVMMCFAKENMKVVEDDPIPYTEEDIAEWERSKEEYEKAKREETNND